MKTEPLFKTLWPQLLQGEQYVLSHDLPFLLTRLWPSQCHNPFLSMIWTILPSSLGPQSVFVFYTCCPLTLYFAQEIMILCNFEAVPWPFGGLTKWLFWLGRSGWISPMLLPSCPPSSPPMLFLMDNRRPCLRFLPSCWPVSVYHIAPHVTVVSEPLGLRSVDLVWLWYCLWSLWSWPCGVFDCKIKLQHKDKWCLQLSVCAMRTKHWVCTKTQHLKFI